MQHFAAQWQPGQQTTHSLRAGQYKRAKRRRDEDSPSDDDGGEDPSPAPSNTQSYASHNPQETEQLRVAGLLPGDDAEIPPKPFPHAPARTSRHYNNSAKLQEALAQLDPPLFAVNATSKSSQVSGVSEAPALRQTHLGVVTAIMHRCLLEGDFMRVGKAWGLILRTQIAGTPIDPRNHGRWGIGAEILLHRRTRDSEDVNVKGQSSSSRDDFYSEEGFELAREYYERLIVQHPNRKHVPRAIDDLTFYPAMFSLWIYEVCEKRKRRQKQFEEQSRLNDDTMDSEDAEIDMASVIAEELAQAREIANRMDQLIISPPFDKHAELLQLRGMVGLWLGDLILQSGASHRSDDWEKDSIIGSDGDEADESTPEKLQRLSQSQREFKRAQESLDRAQTNGRPLTSVMHDVDTKINQLSKKIAGLGAG